MSNQTRKRKKSTRKIIKGETAKVARSQSGTRVQVEENAMSKQQQIANTVLDRAVKATASGIRSGSKALARISQDPEVQKEFAITVEKVGDALAAVAENSGEITAEMVEKFAPAFKQYVFAGSDMIQDTVFDAAMGAVGAIPVVGDVVSTAGQVFDSANENGWRSFWATYKAIPHAVNIAGQAVTNAGENAQVLNATNQQFQKMTNAFNNVAKAVEMESAVGAKTKKQSGGRRNRCTKKKRRKKGTKKKARKRTRKR